MTSAGVVPPNLIPLVGDVAAFDFDLLGTPFALATTLSFASDLAVSDLGSGLLQDIPSDVFNSLQFGVGSRLNLLTADVGILTNALNDILQVAPSSSARTRQEASSPPRVTAGFDPTAIGPLAGDGVLLGIDVASTPLLLTTALTTALSAASLDLGAGQVQFVAQDVATNLRVGIIEAQTRIANDLNGIATTLARLTGTSTQTASHVVPANSPKASTASSHAQTAAATRKPPKHAVATAKSPTATSTKTHTVTPTAKQHTNKPKHRKH